MKEKILKSNFLCITLILVMLSLTGVSQPGSQDKPRQQEKELRMPPQPPQFPQPPENCRPDHGFPPKLDLPEMTSEQEEQLKTMGTKHMQALIPLKAQLAEKEAGLIILLIADNPDSKKISTSIEEISKLRTNILKQVVDHDLSIRKILTPEQKVVFDLRPKPFIGSKDH